MSKVNVFRVELSRSRSSKHVFRALLLAITKGKDVIQPLIEKKIHAKTLYSEGEAFYVMPRTSDNLMFYVQLFFVKNWRNKVKGYIEVFDIDKVLRLKAKYEDNKIRRICGDPRLGWVIERVLSHLKIPYNRINMRTGAPYGSQQDRELCKSVLETWFHSPQI